MLGLEREHAVVDMYVSFGFEVEDEDVAMVRAVLQGGLLEFVLAGAQVEQDVGGDGEEGVAHSFEVVGGFGQFT